MHGCWGFNERPRPHFETDIGGAGYALYLTDLHISRWIIGNVPLRHWTSRQRAAASTSTATTINSRACWRWNFSPSTNLRVPKLARLVKGTRDDLVPPRIVEGNRVHDVAVPVKRQQLVPCAGVPYLVREYRVSCSVVLLAVGRLFFSVNDSSSQSNGHRELASLATPAGIALGIRQFISGVKMNPGGTSRFHGGAEHGEAEFWTEAFPFFSFTYA